MNGQLSQRVGVKILSGIDAPRQLDAIFWLVSEHYGCVAAGAIRDRIRDRPVTICRLYLIKAGFVRSDGCLNATSSSVFEVKRRTQRPQMGFFEREMPCKSHANSGQCMFVWAAGNQAADLI